jgi:hypothetical protein
MTRACSRQIWLRPSIELEAAALRENREGVGTLVLDGTSLIHIFGKLLITGGA